MMMRRFDSKIYPAIHTASDEIIREQKAKIEEMKKRENIAKVQIKKLEREVVRS
jgi:cell division protein FtsB